MRNKKVEEYGGKICNTCEYYDPLEGWCKKHKNHQYCIGECDKWKIANDLVEHRPKKRKEYEQLKIL